MNGAGDLRDASDWYDVAQICLNGHVVNPATKESPSHSKRHCPKCGVETTTRCPACGAEIQGEYHMQGIVSFEEFQPPAFCHACGKPYPWTRVGTDKPAEPAGVERAKDSPADVMSGPILQALRYDCFICHASEDKPKFVRDLAHALRDADCEVWYDDFVLKAGDRLRSKIDQGLRSSRYGVVVLSPSFFVKDWPQKELDGLAALAQSRGILPVWLDVDKRNVAEFSPMLADIVAVRASDGVDAVVEKLLDAMGKERALKTREGRVGAGPGGHFLGSETTLQTDAAREEHARRKRKTRSGRPSEHPPGSIGAQLFKRAYVHYLIGRYKEFKQAERSYGKRGRFSHAVIYANIEHKFGGQTFFLPEGMFEALVQYLTEKIDHTIQGKRNKARRIPNYHSFQEHSSLMNPKHGAES